jgi:uncharacterized membrane protein YfcA
MMPKSPMPGALVAYRVARLADRFAAHRVRAGNAALAFALLAGVGDLAGGVIGKREGDWLAIATAAVIMISALIASIAGFAFSAIAGSALAWLKLDPVHAVQAMVLCSVATQTYAVWTIREAIRWNGMWPMLAAGALTIPLGVWLLVRTPPAVYAIGLGVFLTLYGAYALFRRRAMETGQDARRDSVGATIAGALGGLTGGLAGMPGAFLTIWCSMRGWDKLRQRAVYQPYILVMQVIALVCLHWAAPLTLHARQDLRLVPFALLGAMGGLALFRRMTNQQFQLAVSALLVVSGAGLLGRRSKAVTQTGRRLTEFVTPRRSRRPR